jgi:hypothetical protein
MFFLTCWCVLQRRRHAMATAAATPRSSPQGSPAAGTTPGANTPSTTGTTEAWWLPPASSFASATAAYGNPYASAPAMYPNPGYQNAPYGYGYTANAGYGAAQGYPQGYPYSGYYPTHPYGAAIGGPATGYNNVLVTVHLRSHKKGSHYFVYVAGTVSIQAHTIAFVRVRMQRARKVLKAGACRLVSLKQTWTPQ